MKLKNLKRKFNVYYLFIKQIHALKKKLGNSNQFQISKYFVVLIKFYHKKNP